MRIPSARQWRAFLGRLPGWAIPLLLVLLFGRFVLLFLFHYLG